MTTPIPTLACANACLPRTHLSLRGISKIVAAVAIAVLLMVAETWAIREAPIWTGACAVTPMIATTGETDGPLRDTAGPIAVLH